MTERINNPENITQEEIDTILADGKKPIIQFSKDSYLPSLLKKLDSLCEIYGEELEVRFYGHYGGAFNAKTLLSVPHVVNLSVDCLQHIESHEEIGKLQNLKSLSFGVYYFEDKSFLSLLNLKAINRLVLGENHKKNIDLSYLSQCENIKELYVVGHTKHIDRLASLPKLKKLSLGSIGKKQNLQFVNKIDRLESLTLILGGRESFEEVINPNLKKIEIIRVRGLKRLGDISRFPKLSYLQIEDQIKLKKVDFSKPLLDLEEFKVITCKSLKLLNGLNKLESLGNMRIYATDIDINDILNSELPKNLKVFAFYTGKVKKDKEIRTILDSRGFSEFS
ncbi:MAG: hypothetical protein KUG78_09445 [Kangiellaceae bacterium]|nr:hypothetical protein [Kangiellaceae bacterium]